MIRVRQLLPAGNLGRTRLAATVISCLALVTDLFQVGNESRPPSWNLAAFLSILLIMAAVVLTHSRGKAPWWDSLTLPVLVLVGGSGLEDPLATIALATAVALVLSLYGPLWLWVVRTVGGFLAVPAAVAISPDSLGREVSWHSTTVLAAVPQLLLMSVMMRGIYLALRRQERDSAREAVLARAGSRMIGVTEVAEVRRLGVVAAEEIIALTPGTVMVILRRGTEGLFVANFAGLPESLRHRAVPDSVVEDPDALGVLVPGHRYWRIETFSADLHQLIGGVGPVPDDVVAAFRTISNQVVLGETACRSYAELDHRAHHDHLTGLPTRAKFFRELEAATAAGEPGSVALLLIDLDDFKAVNDTHGHATGDELLIEIAGRIVAAGGPGSTAARFGGDEFALLLTGITGPSDALALARGLCGRIVAPARLTGTTVSAGASIGIALAEPGVGTGELTRRADLAMYAAKAEGKNGVELFGTPAPLQHA